MSAAKDVTITIEDELDDLRAEVVLLRRALAELAVSCSSDLAKLSPTNPFSGSGHIQGMIQRYFPSVGQIVAEYFRSGTSYADDVEQARAKIAKQRAERGSDHLKQSRDRRLSRT